MTVAQENRWKRKCIADFNAVNDRQIEAEAFSRPKFTRLPVAPPSANPTRREVRNWMRLNWSDYETATALAEGVNVALNLPKEWLDDPDHWVWDEALLAHDGE